MGCIESQNQNRTTRAPITTYTRRNNSSHPVKRNKQQQPYVSRLCTNVKIQDIKMITDEERRAGYQPAYACPICCVYFNKIVACSQCKNFICHTCFMLYEKKWKRQMKCSFCSSKTSKFQDYDEQAHSYFDSSKNGFLAKEERDKIDQQMGVTSKIKNPSKLSPIVQEIH